MKKSLRENKSFSVFWPFLLAFFGIFFLLFLFVRKKEEKEAFVESTAMPKDLNQRQEKILEVLTLRREITVEELMKDIKGVSERTLRRDMGKLEELGFSKKQGNTKGSKYIYTK